MTTINAVDTTLLGQSGTGAFSGNISPTFTTPTLGAATATSLAFSPTTDGIFGTISGDNASSGFVGQFISSVVPFASAVSMTNNIPNNVTSISLPAGDWQVNGNIRLSSTVTMTNGGVWTSTTSATIPDASLSCDVGSNTSTFAAIGLPCPLNRINVTTTTTVYLSCVTSFTSGSVVACGGIFATRIR